MKKQTIALCLAALGVTLAGVARAADDSGAYIGANVGTANLSSGGDRIDRAFAAQGLGTSTSLDRNDTAYGLTLGYRINRWFAVEGDYANFGSHNLSATVNSPVADTINGKFKADGFALDAVGIVPLENGFSAYGKLGWGWTHSKLDASSTGLATVSNTSHDGNGVTFGLGVSYDFNRNVSADLEWDRYNRIGTDSTTGRTDADLYTVGLAYHF